MEKQAIVDRVAAFRQGGGPAALTGAWLLVGLGAWAQPVPAPMDPTPTLTPTPNSAPAPTATPPAAPADSPQRVTVQDSTDPNEARRRSTASKITYGREEIERMGDSNLGEILKRLPGVTTGGAPGRGGNPRMRGLGGGYTQILVDGERMPPGFTVDAIEPDQVERIEIMRAPVAEFGARAIAGTINIVLREEFRPRLNALNAALAFQGPQADLPQGSLSWSRGDRDGTTDYTLTGTVSARRQADASQSAIDAYAPGGAPTLVQRLQGHSSSDNTAAALSGRWRWQSGRDRWELQPSLNLNASRGRGHSDLQQTLGVLPAPYAQSDSQSESHSEQGRLAGHWMTALDNGARLILRGGTSFAFSTRSAQSLQRDALGGTLRQRQDDSRIEDISLNHSGRWSQLWQQDHSLVAGWEVQLNHRLDQRTLLENGVSRLADFGEDVQARTRRVALYVQDDWELDRRRALNLGLRWEGITTGSDSSLQSVANTSGVLTPLLHGVWRMADRSRDQVRLSLTRSYRPPTTAQLIARPVLSGLYPVDGPNTALSPDRAGNPQLKPEIARGIDLAVERYLEAGGILSAGVFYRHIDDLIRNIRAQQAVPWSPALRWVASPRNIGTARTAGIELEARFRAADIGLHDWPLTVRTNASRFWSRVDQVPGPDNRLDQQPTWTANLGLDWSARVGSVGWGGNLNVTPPYAVRQIDGVYFEQGRRRVFDAYALWRLTALSQLRLSASNAAPRSFETVTTAQQEDGALQRQQSVARTYAVVGLRLEHKF